MVERQENDIQVRPMRPDEADVVRGIMKASFPSTKGVFFSMSPHVLVAERDGEVEGAIVPKIVSLPRNRKAGLFAWAFIRPEMRGKGTAQIMVRAATEFFDEQGCDELLACIEGHNTSSSSLFSNQDYVMLSPWQQFRRWGPGILSVWKRIFHYLDIGYFVWARTRPEEVGESGNRVIRWFGCLAVNLLVLMLALWRLAWFGCPELNTVLAATATCLFLFGLRDVAMRLGGKAIGQKLRYRAWESGFPLSVAIGAITGRFFPMPGSLYPADKTWRHQEFISKLALIALASSIPMLLFASALWVAYHFGNLSPGNTALIAAALYVAKHFVMFDIAMPFFPFASYNGRRIWNWNKVVWGVMGAVALIVFFVPPWQFPGRL